MHVLTRHLNATAFACDAGVLPTLTLPFQRRRRSRQKVTLDNGETMGIALDKGSVLCHGDILGTAEGRYVRIRAAQEHVLHVSAESAQALARAAYHLGNRHVALQINPDSLLLEFDAVLEAMLQGLAGIAVTQINAPFEPETGAYGGGHKHGHDETFDEDYALAQSAYAAHGHGHTHTHT